MNVNFSKDFESNAKGTKSDERTARDEGENFGRGKTAVVFGGSSGIGRETVRLLLNKGYSVYNLSRGECKLEGVNNLHCDVSKPQEIEEAYQRIYGDISLMVYSAGFSMAAPLEYAKAEDYEYLFAVNLFGALRAVQCALPKMKRAGGNIIIVSSLGGVVPIAFDCFYSSSKAAVDMLVKGCAPELKKYGVRITSVQPGGTKTGFTFKRKVYSYDEVGDYSGELAMSVDSLRNIEQGGMDASRVAEIIVDVAQKANPPLTVACGIMNKAVKVCDRILPTKAVVSLSKRIYYK